MKHTRRTRRALPALTSRAAASIASLLLLGCEQANSQPHDTANLGIVVTASVVIARPIIETQEFSGRLEPIEHVQIRSRVGGYINAVNFQPGSLVRKGQGLFVIDPRPYKAEAARAKAAVNSARAKSELATLELIRAEKLLADNAIALREYDERASAQTELDANVDAAEAQYDNARLNLSYTQIRSPIDGRVSKAEITIGNLIDPSAVLTSVVSGNEFYASFDGDEDTYLRVAPHGQRGTPVRVRVGLANESGFPHEGNLEFVDNRLDSNTGAVRMRARLQNADQCLSPGLYARVQLESSGRSAQDGGTVLINDRAIGTDQNRKFVYVINADGQAEYRQVMLGNIRDGLRIVERGLTAGEKVVVNGNHRVRPGAWLTPQLVAMDAQLAPYSTKSDAKLAAADTTKGN